MSTSSRKVQPHLVYLDAFLVDRAAVQMGLALTLLASTSGVRYATVSGISKGGGMLASTARALAEKLGRDVLDLLAPWDPRYVPPKLNDSPFGGSTEWECTDYLEPGHKTSNGLYYIVCRMQHRHSPAKQGRGKFYHLSWVPQAKRDSMRHMLSRHADVCSLVGIHQRIAVNLTSTPVTGDDGWWVIDEWVGEQSLADRLKTAPWPAEELPQLLLDIASGLQILHQAQIVLRELAPCRILISDRDNRAVLTDFELAKLFDGGPSVSTEWEEDPFRAPEVGGGEISIRADLYSFGQVVGAALNGPGFDPGRTADLIAESNIPDRLQRLLLACIEPSPERRKVELPQLIKELTRWAKG